MADSGRWAVVVGVAVALLAGLAFFGVVGLRVLAAFVAFFALPAYLLLRGFGLDGEERVFFSVFVGIGVFPVAVWAVNRVVASFAASAVVVLALCVGLWMFFGLWRGQ